MTPASNTVQPRQKRAGRRWIATIFGLLILQMGMTIFGAVWAIRGGKALVEDDYYNKALHWDDHEALVRASAALGWKATLSVAGAATTEGDHAMILHLAAADGAALDEAQVQVAYFHHAAPLALRTVELKSVGHGDYACSTPLPRAGIWEFRITISRKNAAGKDDLFIETIQQDLFE